jgi:hypothetical protein
MNLSKKTTESTSSEYCRDVPWVVPFQIARWLLLLKIEMSFNDHYCCIVSHIEIRFKLFQFKFGLIWLSGF